MSLKEKKDVALDKSSVRMDEPLDEKDPKSATVGDVKRFSHPQSQLTEALWREQKG